MFFKSKNNNCQCSCGDCSDTETKKVNEEIKSIIVLGSGCSSCEKLYNNVLSAVKELNLNIEPEYIKDINKIIEYGVLLTPALIINGNIVSSGKVFSPKEIIELIK